MSEYGSMLPMLYAFDHANGWSKGMRAVTHALLSPLQFPPGPILEVGCGAGVFNAELTAATPDHTIIGTDLHPLALAHAQHNVCRSLKLARADLHALPFATGEVGTLFALDTFDQVGVDLPSAMAESWRVLRDRGMLILRVSAYSWLRSSHDAAFNTGRRFTRCEVGQFLHRHGFELLRLTYANTILAPPIMLLRLLDRWRWIEFDLFSGHDSPLNALLEETLKWEARWLRRHNFAYGISLYAVARKQRGQSDTLP